MPESSAGTVGAQVLLVKEALWDPLDAPESSAGASAKRDALAPEAWWRPSWHLTGCAEFLPSETFDRMGICPAQPDVPGGATPRRWSTCGDRWRPSGEA